MFNSLFAFLYRLFGWKIIGSAPHGVQKAIWVGAPHHSNWDFIISVGARATLDFKIGYLAKKELFTWYAGWLFRALGGHPVDRARAGNLVDAVVYTFSQNDTLHVAITPEGTRTDVHRLRSGFYYMALKAGVPLILVGFDYGRKAFVIREPLYLTGDIQQDMKLFCDFYLTIQSPRKSWQTAYEQTGQLPIDTTFRP